MTRSRFMKTLLTATACGGLVWAQTANPTPPLESRIGKVITVQEANRQAEKCVVVQVWRSPEGHPVMQAQGVKSGKMMTIVEQPNAAAAADRFRVFHWSDDGQPPQGCPLSPEMEASRKPAKEVVQEKKEVKEVVAAVKPASSAHAVKQEIQTVKGESTPVKAVEPAVVKEAVKPAETDKVVVKPADKVAKAAEPQKVVVKPVEKVTKAAEPEKVVLKPVDKVAKPAESDKVVMKPVDKVAKPAESEKVVIKPADKVAKPAVVAKTPEPEKVVVKPVEKVAKVQPAAEKMVLNTYGEPTKSLEIPAKPVALESKTAAQTPAKPAALESKTVVQAPAADRVVAKPQSTQSAAAAPVQTERVTAPSPYGSPGTERIVGATPYGAAGAGTQNQGSTQHVTGSPYNKDTTATSSISYPTVPPRQQPAQAPGGDFVSRAPSTGGDYVSRAPAKVMEPSSKPIEQVVRPAAPKQVAGSPNQEPERIVKAPVVKTAKPAEAPMPDMQGAVAEHRVINLTKADGSPMRCAVLSESIRADGAKVNRVKILETGEVVTIVEEAQLPPTVVKAPSMSMNQSPRPSAPPSLTESGKPSYMQPSASLSVPPAPDLPPSKPTLFQRVKDKLHGSDQVVEKPKDDSASKKYEDMKSSDKCATAKKDEAKYSDKSTAAKLEPPKPAENVDWHKSWEAEVKPKAPSSVAKNDGDLPVKPELSAKMEMAKSAEHTKKVDSWPPVTEMKPMEKKEEAPKAPAMPEEKAVASKKMEAGGAPSFSSPVMPPAPPVPALEPVKVAAAPMLPEPRMPEAPKMALAPPMVAEAKLPEPKVEESPKFSMTPPIPAPKMPEPRMEEKRMVAEVPMVPAMRPSMMEPKRPEAKPQEKPGVGFADSGKGVMSQGADMYRSTYPSAGLAEVSQPRPKQPVIDPEVKKAQAVKYGAVLMELLQNSGTPSEREMAAVQLRTADESQVPMAAQALVQAAKNDSAPLVRIAAMQSLMAMQIHTAEVKTMLETAVTDRDPRVRDEAKLALSLMNKPPEVRPASYRR